MTSVPEDIVVSIVTFRDIFKENEWKGKETKKAVFLSFFNDFREKTKKGKIIIKFYDEKNVQTILQPT